MNEKIKLLVADDEAVVRNFIRSMVEKEKLPVSEILEAENGLDAARLARENRPDLAILDIRMPGLNGLEASVMIMKECPEARVYIISAYDEFDYARTAFKSGICDYLLKPVRPAQIVEIVGTALRLRRQTAPEAAEATPRLIQAVTDFVEANLARPLSLDDIAKATFVSPCHLSRKFKALAGCTITAFIQNRRLEKAADLLRATEESVTEIADQVGFTNPSYFATCFKTARGQTPQQYRKTCQTGRMIIYFSRNRQNLTALPFLPESLNSKAPCQRQNSNMENPYCCSSQLNILRACS